MILMFTVPDELQEADVLWPPERRRCVNIPTPPPAATAPAAEHQRKESAPIKIPQPLHGSAGVEEYDGGDGMVPPHELVARRWAREKMACSVCTGQGRTLKGRDLRHVRNSVLRLTGFLER